MDIKVKTNISKEYEDIEVVINAPEKNEQVTRIENSIAFESSEEISKLIGMQNNDIFVINSKDIIMIYSEDNNTFCKTVDGNFRIKEKLYYLEDNLSKKDFVRISNSAIVNINKVKCFNTSIVGRMVVKFFDGTSEAVSRRRTSEIMKFLTERM